MARTTPTPNEESVLAGARFLPTSYIMYVCPNNKDEEIYKCRRANAYEKQHVRSSSLWEIGVGHGTFFLGPSTRVSWNDTFYTQMVSYFKI